MSSISRIKVPVGIDTAHVIHSGGDSRLYTWVIGGGIDSEATPAADADYPYFLRIHIRTGSQVINSRAEILGIDVGRSDISGRAAALAGI